MNNQIAPALEIVIPAYRMHTQTFNNALHGISEADAWKRIENRTNHILWMTGNLVNTRYWLADVLGIGEKDPNEDLFKDAKALDEKLKYPSLESLKIEWHKISRIVFQKIIGMSPSELKQPYSFGMNVSFVEENKLNMAGMCIDRESYLFGQIGLMRRILGYPGMSYEMNNDLGY